MMLASYQQSAQFPSRVCLGSNTITGPAFTAWCGWLWWHKAAGCNTHRCSTAPKTRDWAAAHSKKRVTRTLRRIPTQYQPAVASLYIPISAYGKAVIHSKEYK
jgi:hypothetical protein